MAVVLPAFLLLAVPAPGFPGQASEPRDEFLDSVGQFSLALAGTHGDEGQRLSTALNSMARALERWDGTIQTYERAMAEDIKDADPQLAARLHLALGGVYLDRGRIADALTQLAAARERDPARADVPLLQGLVHAQLTGDSSAATEALQAAASLDPQDPVRAYLLARQLLTGGKEPEGLSLLARVQRRQDPNRTPQGVPASLSFVRLAMVPETADIDNDGDLDLLVTNSASTPDLLRNGSGGENNAVLVRLIGTGSNRNAIGARLRLSAGGRTQVREVRAGSSYLGQHDLRVHFGLGRAASIDRLEIRWPNGQMETVSKVGVNQTVTITEGKGVTKSEARKR